jgi:hypothetical protein
VDGGDYDENNTMKTVVPFLRLERYWHCLLLVLEDCDERYLEASADRPVLFLIIFSHNSHCAVCFFLDDLMSLCNISF